jgi:type VI secretion system protein ImpF
MGDLNLRERLQPSLLDRLTDDERLLTVYELTFAREQLDRLHIEEGDLVLAIAAAGLVPAGTNGSAVVQGSVPDALCLRFSAPYGRVDLSQLKALPLELPNGRGRCVLESTCRIAAYTASNDTVESPERRYATTRRLREYVCRDIGVLLNATSLETTVDLTEAPDVRQSVLNYGMPSLAGKSVSSLDLAEIARIFERAIRNFEPRLRKVRVAPDTENKRSDEHEISFRIDAELWGQPTPHQIVLRTRLNVESGDVRVDDSGRF